MGHFVPADGAGGGGGPRQLRLPILAPLSTLSPEEQHEAHFSVVERYSRLCFYLAVLKAVSYTSGCNRE